MNKRRNISELIFRLNKDGRFEAFDAGTGEKIKPGSEIFEADFEVNKFDFWKSYRSEKEQGEKTGDYAGENKRKVFSRAANKNILNCLYCLGVTLGEGFNDDNAKTGKIHCVIGIRSGESYQKPLQPPKGPTEYEVEMDIENDTP